MKTNDILRRIVSLLLILTLVTSAFVNLPFSISAEDTGLQGGQSNIVNGGFEYPNLKELDTNNTGWKGIAYDGYNESELGWKTTSTDKKIEYGWLKKDGSSPHMVSTIVTEIKDGVGASDGWQFAEVVSSEVSSLYQILEVNSGENYSWTVHHRGRSGTDTLAFIITDEDNSVNYVKPDKNQSDRFQQILTWLKKWMADNGKTAPAAGKSDEYTVYTTKLKDSNSFNPASSGSFFSFKNDSEHTVEFKIYLMSSAKEDWGKYKGSYYSGANKNIMFVLTPFSTSFLNSSGKNETSGGNLIDNMSFADENGQNLLINSGFDDVAISGSYSNLNAANASTSTKGVGWCTTATDYKVEVGNIQKGNAYGLDVTVQTVTKQPTIKEGDQFAELNAEQESSLYQIVDTDPGKMYRWGLSHRGRSGKDTMALIIGPNQTYAPKKTSPTDRDQLMQMVDWLYSQTDVALDIPETGCSDEIKLYTSKFNDKGGFSGANISWQSDDNHTEEWSIWIISSPNNDWYDYGYYDTGAAYNYNYIVPHGQTKTVFGFVSVNAVNASGIENKTYGNLLDNIEFKEFYYVNADFNKTPIEEYGTVKIIPEVDGTFEPDDTTEDTGWVSKGSNITVYYQLGDRDFIGGYINGVFYPNDNPSKDPNDENCKWKFDETKQAYYYTFENVNSSITVNIIYQAKNVIYDSCSPHPYQYNGEGTNYEVPLDENFNEYTSHAPEADDGWKFMGWKYISTHESEIKTYMFDAVHKVQYYKDNNNKFLRIYKILPDNSDQLVVDKIPESEGITFFAQWKYRQRVIAQTFNVDSNSYEEDTEGGTVEVKFLYTDEENPETATDYTPDGKSSPVGQELFAYSGDTYIGVTAKNKIGYLFSGWYDNSGVLITRNPTYSYKVIDGGVTQLYAHFDPIGYDVTVNTKVIGNTEDEGKYFAINCTFEKLRENNIYAITGLPNNNNITVNGETVVNPTNIKADENGKAKITLYMKHGDSAKLLHLPAGAVYSVTADNSTKSGFSVRGEVPTETLLKEEVVDLFFYKADQFVSFDFGKHYEGILSQQSPQEITITQKSSYTLGVETQYTPSIYQNLNISLCFYNSDGLTAKEFFTGTRILMIDLTDSANPKYYSYTVNTSKPAIALTEFIELGSADAKFATKKGDMLTEKLVFIVDYVGTNNAESGKIALVYGDDNNELSGILTPVKKTVKIGEDTTSIAAAKVGNGITSSNGPFAMSITVGESSAINTTYREGDFTNSEYAVKLSLNGDKRLPDGSYAVVGGKTYYCNDGYINISPLKYGAFYVNVYSPVPVELVNNKVTFNAILLSAVTASATVPAEKYSEPIEYNCADVAIDADVVDKVLNPGKVSAVDVTLKYSRIDEVRLNISKKNSDQTFSAVLENVNVSLPNSWESVTVSLGDKFTAVSGETYIFTFVGYSGNVPVIEDKCCVVGGYISKP